MSTREEITNFSLKIEELVKEKNLSYMDAILLYCENNNLEIEVAAKLISGALKAKLQVEAETLNFLPKSESLQLPI